MVGIRGSGAKPPSRGKRRTRGQEPHLVQRPDVSERKRPVIGGGSRGQGDTETGNNVGQRWKESPEGTPTAQRDATDSLSRFPASSFPRQRGRLVLVSYPRMLLVVPPYGLTTAPLHSGSLQGLKPTEPHQGQCGPLGVLLSL